MAGDWIKMRGALLDHPKVIAIARELHASEEFREWLTPGGGGPTNGQIVSVAALRGVTVALLMKVWSGSREHGRFDDCDLHLPHSIVDDLDQMAGAPGVGAAMAAVGWAVKKEGICGVFLPNFKEFNVPMTPAEKQSEYRKRQLGGNGNVTKTLPATGNKTVTREEKRREEKKHIRAHKTPLPESFGLSPRVIDWAKAHGFGRLQEHLDAFRLKAVAADYRYADWDAAFMEAIRADWARVNTKPAQRDEFRNVL